MLEMQTYAFAYVLSSSMLIIISFGQKGAEKDLEWMTGVHNEDVSV